MAQFCQTLAWRSQKGGDKATLKRSCGHKNFMEKWSCTSVALHCCCSGTALLLGYESSPAAVAMQCQTSSKVLPRQRENFATEMGELCFSDRYADNQAWRFNRFIKSSVQSALFWGQSVGMPKRSATWQLARLSSINRISSGCTASP